MLVQAFGLRVGQILTRDKYVLVERHIVHLFQRASKPGSGLLRPSTRGIRVNKKLQKEMCLYKGRRETQGLDCALQER